VDFNPPVAFSSQQKDHGVGATARIALLIIDAGWKPARHNNHPHPAELWGARFPPRKGEEFRVARTGTPLLPGGALGR